MATATGPEGTEFTVRITLDPSDMAVITRQISKAFAAGFDASGKQFNEFTQKMSEAAKKSFSKMAGPASNLTGEFKHMGREATNFTEEFSKDAVDLIQTFKKMNLAIQEVVSGVNLVKEQGRRASIETTTRQTDANRLAVEQIRERSKANFAASQKEEILAKTAAATQINAAKIASRESITEARISAQRRAMIHKQLFTQIRAIEKSLGSIIKTTYQDASKVIGKAFSGLGTIGSGIAQHLRRNSTAIQSEMRDMTSSVQKNSKKMNSEFTEGVNSALNKRERLLRSSFTTQEQILTRSAIRQQAAMTKMRASVSTGVLGATTGRGIGMGVGALIGGVGIVAGLKAGFTAAVNMNEQINKTGVLFGESAKAVVAWSRNSVKEIGATSDAALQAAGTFGNIFRGADIAEKPAAMMSVQMAKLAADLSSFNNIPIEDVFVALKAGLVGEMEPLRSLGVVLNDAELRQRSFLQGTSDGKSVLNASACAQAAYSLIMEKTTLAQGDYARTAKEGANAIRTAAAAAKQFLMTALIPLVPIVSTLANGFTALFTAITNTLVTTNPMIHEFRRAMAGAAVAMLAVIAAKGVIEVFKLTAAALKLVATPMGTILIVAGLLGAAFVILSDQSAELRASLDVIGQKLVDIGKKIGKEVQPLFKTFGDLVRTEVVPAVRWLAQWLADHLIGAFDATVRFVEDKLIPALQMAAGFIGRMATLGFDALIGFIHTKLIPAFKTLIAFLQDEVYPVLVGIGQWFQSAFDVAWGALQDFWAKAQPVLQPIIDGFKTLGSAITSALSGDFSGLGSGAKAVASGFAETFSTIGQAVTEMLSNAWAAIRAWLSTTFSGANLIQFAKGFLDLIERIGYILGNIVSDPIFLAALAAIAAAAALVALRFAEGVAKGILSNLPMIVTILGGALVLAFSAAIKYALSNPAVVLAVFLGLKALFGLKGAFNAFQTAGKGAGDGFLAGFRKSLKTEAGAATGFMHGLFGSPGSSVQKYYKDVNKAMRIETANLQRGIRAFGGTMIVDDRNLKEAKKQLQLLTKDLNTGAQHGLLLRDSFTQAGSAARGIGKGARQVANDIGQAFSGVRKAIGSAFDMAKPFTTLKGQAKVGAAAFGLAFRSNLSGLGGDIALGLKGAFDSVKTFLNSQGIVTGAQFARAFIHAVGKGLLGLAAVVGGFMAGQAEGQAGGSGLISALLGGVTVAAMIPGAFGAAVGVVTAGAALIGAKFGEAKKRAQELREELKRLSGTFTDELVKAIEAGAVAVQGMTLDIDFTKFLGLGDLRKFTKESIAAKLSAGATDALLAAGIDMNDVIDLLNQANGDSERFAKTFGDAMVTASTSTKEFSDTFGVAAPKVAAMLKDLVAPGGLDTVDQMIAKLTKANITGKNTDMINLLAKHKIMLDNIIRGVSDVTNESKLIIKAYLDAQKKAALLADKPLATPQFGPERLNQTARDIVTNMEPVISAMIAASDASKGLWVDLVKAGMSADDASAALAKLDMPPAPAQDIENWQKALGTITTEIDKINKQLDEMPGKFAEAIAAATGIPAPTVVDQDLIDASGAATQVQTALVGGINTVTGSSEYNQAIGGITTSLGKAISDGVASGTVVDDASLLVLIDKVHTAMVEGLDPNSPEFTAAKAAVDAVFTTIPPLNVLIDQEQVLLQAAEMQRVIQKYMTENPLVSRAEAEYRISIGDGDESVGKMPPAKDLLPKIGWPTNAELKAAVAPSGAAIGQGLADGMNDPTAKALVRQRARELADEATAAFNKKFKIDSPSKVMHGIGLNLAEGLALGMEHGISTATTAAQKLAQASLDAAHGVMSGAGTLPFGGSSPSSFVGGFGQPGSGTTVGGSTTTSTIIEGSSAPLVGQLTIVETGNAQQTARKVVTELRSEALLARRRP